MHETRLLALEVLNRCLQERIPADILLAPRLARSSLDERDRRFVTQLVRATHRWRGRADRVLDVRLKRGVRSLDLSTLNILRLAYVQLFHLDQIPPHAAVHTAVDLTWRKSGEGKARLVNSVLRGLLSKRPEPAEWRRGRGADALEGELSHPAWLLERWLAHWGEQTTRAVCAWNNEPPDVHVRVHGDEATRGDVRTALAAEGFGVQGGALLEECLRLEGGSHVRGHPLLRDGKLSIQDESQALVGRLWPDPRAVPVLDMCAAPGTKSSHLAEQTGTGPIVATDLAYRRIQRVAATRARLGLEQILPLVADARRLPFRQPFARVLLDAPCSGLGVLRRRPDARWLRTPGELHDAARLQRKLLDAAAALVAPGGWLVYSVCSLEPEETGRQVEAFLGRWPGFRPSPLPEWIPAQLRDAGGALCVVPGSLGMEGVYAAVMQRRDGAQEPQP